MLSLKLSLDRLIECSGLREEHCNDNDRNNSTHEIDSPFHLT